MSPLHVKKGYDLKIAGRLSPDVEVLEKPDHVALCPEKIPFIKPRLKIRLDDTVKIGSVLFEDKRNPDVKFLSPGGGKVVNINFGPRRVIREIVIRLDADEQAETFEPVSEEQLVRIERKELVAKIMAGGLWPFIRELPFRDLARPGKTPPAIFVNLCRKEPFQVDPDVYLEGQSELFNFGVNILQKLTKQVHIFRSPDLATAFHHKNGVVTHVVQGQYPADDPGVFLYYTRKSPADNHAWYIQGQDVLLLAHLLKFGTYPFFRTVAVAGPSVEQGTHVRTRMGAPVSHIVRDRVREAGVRFIAGGIFRGYTLSPASYLGLYETAVTLLPEGDEKEFLGFARPGFGKPSHSRTFLSFFNTAELKMDCTLHGEERACINCGYCTDVCPVDILPQFTLKRILAGEVEDSLAHGLLDCVACGLCTYVCPSKIALCDAFTAAKRAYYQELV